jgi:hypothetical protein
LVFDKREDFLRRVPWYQFNFEKQEIFVLAFRNHHSTPDRLSVNWAIHSSVKQTAEVLPGSGVASITAEVCYREKQEIEHTPEEENYAHCDVIGDKPSSVQRRLRNAARLLLPPTPPGSPNS